MHDRGLSPPSWQTVFPDLEQISASDGGDGQRPPEKSSSAKGKRRSPDGSQARVLLISGIWEVALYRAEVLRGQGLEVLTPRSKEEAMQAIRRREADVVVLTYTLPSETVHELADLVRQYCPECRLVAISESGKFDERVAPDAIVIANQGPAALIKAIRRLTRIH
jgi:CheY-like chemotaxis protein